MVYLIQKDGCKKVIQSFGEFLLVLASGFLCMWFIMEN